MFACLFCLFACAPFLLVLRLVSGMLAKLFRDRKLRLSEKRVLSTYIEIYKVAAELAKALESRFLRFRDL